MKNIKFCFIFLLTGTLSISAQDNTIKDQFVDVIDKSNSYEEYKVIKRVKLATLRKNILDTVALLKQNIETTTTQIELQKNNIASLNQELKVTQENLTLSKEKENSIELFGFTTTKSSYNTIMWFIIGFLLVALGYLFLKYKNSHSVTKASKIKLLEIEEEFETHRQKNLESEQLLRRKLQDEINFSKKPK